MESVLNSISSSRSTTPALMTERSMLFKFRQDYTQTKRIEVSNAMRKKYPNRVPVIVAPAGSRGNIPTITQEKFIISKDLTIGAFMFQLRKKMTIMSDEAIFLFVGNGIIPPTSATMGSIDERFHDDDGFLYVQVTIENTFG